MGRRGSQDAAVLLWGGYDLRGTTTDYVLEKESPLEDTTVIGDSDSSQQAVGFIKTMLSLNGFYDDAANASNAALVGPANTRPLVLALEGNTAGKAFVGVAGAIEYKYNRVVKVGSLHKANASFAMTGKVDEGKIQVTQQTISGVATSTRPTVDNGAATANGGAGYLEIVGLTLGGYTSVTVTVQDSADGSTGWATILTHTAATVAPFADVVAITGAVRRYTRAIVTFNGTGSSQSITLFQGFARR